MRIFPRHLIERSCFNVLLLCLALYSPGAYTQEPEIAGRVVSVNGVVSALDPNGNSRSLARRDEIRVGDTIITDASSFAQLRMSDSAIVSFQEHTRFEIVAYSYEQNPGSDTSTMRLIQGGFRTITGSIGEQDPSAYSIETEYATIGIRGTDFSIVIPIELDAAGNPVPTDDLYAGIFDGTADITNIAGTLGIGVGEDYDYAVVFDPNQAPQGLTLQPTALGLVAVLTISVSDEEEGDGDGDGGGGNGNDGDGDGNGGGDGNDGDGEGNGGVGGGNGGAGNNNAGGGNNAAGGNNGCGNAGAGNAFGNFAGGGGGGGAPTPTLNDQQNSGIDTSGLGGLQDTSALTVNPNETSGDGTIDCAVNSNIPACRPEEDEEEQPPESEPEPEPEPQPQPEPEPQP